MISEVVAALLGAVAGGVIPAMLQHHREQRYAARTLLAWAGETRKTLAPLLEAMAEAPAGDRFRMWKMLRIATLPTVDRSHLMRALPEWLDNALVEAHVLVEQLTLHSGRAIADGAIGRHDSLVTMAEMVVSTLSDTERLLGWYLDEHSDLFGDTYLTPPEAWRRERITAGRRA